MEERTHQTNDGPPPTQSLHQSDPPTVLGTRLQINNGSRNANQSQFREKQLYFTVEKWLLRTSCKDHEMRNQHEWVGDSETIYAHINYHKMLYGVVMAVYGCGLYIYFLIIDILSLTYP